MTHFMRNSSYCCSVS